MNAGDGNGKCGWERWRCKHACDLFLQASVLLWIIHMGSGLLCARWLLIVFFWSMECVFFFGTLITLLHFFLFDARTREVTLRSDSNLA